MCLIEDLFGSAEVHQFPQHLMAARIFGACGQLSIGERTGPAFAKLHVAPGIQRSALPVTLYALHALFQTLSPLQHERTIAGSGQHQRRKHAAGAKTDHDRAMGEPFAACCRQHKGTLPDHRDIRSRMAKHLLFIRDLTIHHV